VLPNHEGLTLQLLVHNQDCWADWQRSVRPGRGPGTGVLGDASKAIRGSGVSVLGMEYKPNLRGSRRICASNDQELSSKCYEVTSSTKNSVLMNRIWRMIRGQPQVSWPSGDDSQIYGSSRTSISDSGSIVLSRKLDDTLGH